MAPITDPEVSHFCGVGFTDHLAKTASKEERPAEIVLILISSLLAWDKTPLNLQEIVHPVEARRRADEAV